MALGSVSVSLFSMLAIVAAVLAGATVWLLLSDPVGVTAALNQGSVTPLVSELADVLANAMRELLRWL
jgi:hypothetical protein